MASKEFGVSPVVIAVKELEPVPLMLYMLPECTLMSSLCCPVVRCSAVVACLRGVAEMLMGLVEVLLWWWDDEYPGLLLLMDDLFWD